MAISCLTRAQIANNGGSLIDNADGTISVYIPDQTGTQRPVLLTKPCCDVLSASTTPTFFDVDTQQCKWTTYNDIKIEPTINVILNPKGSDGEWFYVTPDETCTLSIDFDFLFKFECNSLRPLATTPNGIVNMLESLSASMVLNTKTGPTNISTHLNNVYEETIFQSIGTGNCYNYLISAGTNTGFYVCGTLAKSTDTSCNALNLYSLKEPNGFLDCADVQNQLIQGLFVESGLPTTATTAFKAAISENTFASNWLHFHTDITDAAIISAITNQKIVLSIKISGVSTDISLLYDNIKLTKSCTKVENNNIFVTQSPGFELDRIKDNKKSWATKNTVDHRIFNVARYDNSNQIRQTDYFVNFDDRQVINTKEIDLDIDIASAVESDVWCYLSDNSCLLTGTTVGTTTCIGEINAQVYTAQTITGLSITSVTTTGTCCPVTAVTSTTVTSSGTTYTCPVGFSATSADDQCQKITISAATYNGSGTIITSGNTDSSYGNLGTYFYPDIAGLGPYPLYYNGSGDLKNQNNTTISALNISNNSNHNSFWYNSGTTTNGRLNKVGIFAPTGKYAGFSQCINIVTEGTYYVGLAADNYANFLVNGIKVVSFNVLTTTNFNKWSIFPIHLKSGLNIIQMEGKNESGVAAFAAEIYDPISYDTLTGATTTGSTQANVIFTTATKVGASFDYASDNSIGYSCPSGFILNTCGISTCTKIENAVITATTTANTVTTTGYCTDLSCVTYTTTAQTTTTSAVTATTITGVTCSTGGFILTAITVNNQTIYVPIPTNDNTYCCSDSCGDKPIDLNILLTQPLSTITTIEDFEYYLTSELIDAKDRQSISSYPTLRLLYDRYKNSLNYCGTKSSGFDYFTMDKFAKLIGNYWVDLVEQVIPATTIWGSTKIYTNTIFDNQKYKYKAYTSLFGLNLNNQKVLSPVKGDDCTVDIVTTVIKGQSTDTLEFFNEGDVHEYNNIYLIQMNSSPEYIGNVNIIGPVPSTPQVIVECTLRATIPTYTSPDYGFSNGTATAVPIGAQGNVLYLWNNGQTTQTAVGLSAGTYSVTITDSVCSTTATVKIPLKSCTLSAYIVSYTGANYTFNNGAATVSGTNINGPLTYHWSDGQTGQTATGLSGNGTTYTVTINDGFCTASTNVTINTIINAAFRTNSTQCETSSTFQVRKTISGMWSPSQVYYYTGSTPHRVYVADADNKTNGNVYWFDPTTATTVSHMNYYTGIKANSLYAEFIDEVYNRIYFVGTDSTTPNGSATGVVTGLIVYDITGNTHTQIPYGDGYPYSRSLLFVTDNYIYSNATNGSGSQTGITRFDRVTPTLPITTTPINTSTGWGYDYFNLGTQTLIQVGNMIWIVGIKYGANIGVFDSSFNHITDITIPNAAAYSGVKYYQNGFYDSNYDKFYVNDIKSKYYHIITNISGNNYTGGTLTSYSVAPYLQTKSYASTSWSIDPVSSKLYMAFYLQDNSTDGSGPNKMYEMDRSTGKFINLFNFVVSNLKIVNDGLSNSLMGANSGNVYWNIAGSTPPVGYDTDGSITFYNNAVSGNTTGMVDVIDLQKYDTLTNLTLSPLVLTANTVGNPYYVAPYFTTTGSCAVTYTLTCPTVNITNSGGTVYYETQFIDSVRLNPVITKIGMSGQNNSYVTVVTKDYFPPYSGLTLDNFTGLTAGATYHLRVGYYSGGPSTYGLMSACTT